MQEALAQKIKRVLSSPSSPAWAIRSLQRIAKGTLTLSERLLLEPELVMIRAGFQPDPWQVELLRHAGNSLSVVSRQRGKTAIAGARAIVTAVVEAPADVLYTARTLRQVKEFMRRTRQFYNALRAPRRVRWEITRLDLEEKLADDEWTKLPATASETIFELALANGSRIIGIPPREETVRGFDNIRRLIIDEASRVPDAFYLQSGAFLATTRGPMDVYSTPFGKRGWFWELADGPHKEDPGWKRVRVPALGCQHADPMCEACRAVSHIRITADWLEQERRRIGERWYRQEYECSFEESLDSLFSQADIEAAMDPTIKAWSWNLA